MENPEMVDLPEKLKHQLRHRELFLSRQLESLPATHIRYTGPGGEHRSGTAGPGGEHRSGTAGLGGDHTGQGPHVRYRRPGWARGAPASPDARSPVSCLAGGSAASLC